MAAALGPYRSLHGMLSPDPVLAASAARAADPVDVDALVVFGADDGYVLGDTHRRQGDAQFLRQLVLMEAPAAGHWPHRERPDLVLPAITDFLGRR